MPSKAIYCCLRSLTRPYCKPKKNFVLPQDYKLNWHWPITARCKPRFAVCMAAQFKAQPTKGKRSAKMSSPIWLKSVTTSCNPLKISAKMTLRLAALSTKCCSMRYVKVPRIFILSRMKTSIGSACAAMASWSKLSNRLAI
ncbi:Uncharacterised protein [Vibrio cholerae]|nr:Uncharacterised protein [Vibrio cholerae]